MQAMFLGQFFHKELCLFLEDLDDFLSVNSLNKNWIDDFRYAVDVDAVGWLFGSLYDEKHKSHFAHKYNCLTDWLTDV